MRRFAFVVGLLGLLFVTGCSPKHAVSVLPAVDVPEESTLGPGDVFGIRVYGEEQLTAKYQAAEDGTISFPFLGAVRVQGKQAHVVAAEIAEALRAGGYFVDPHVSIFVEESNSRRISVLGAVAKPGTLPLIAGMTVVQAVSQAGGFTPLASKDETVITRRVQSKLERYRVPVSEIARGNVGDVTLRAGDIVFVPERVF